MVKREMIEEIVSDVVTVVREMAEVPQRKQTMVEGERELIETVIVHPVEGKKKDSSETSKRLKELVQPKELGVRVRRVREISGGGVFLELYGNGGKHILERAIEKDNSLVVPEMFRKRPRGIVYDLPREISKKETESLFRLTLGESEERAVKVLFLIPAHDDINWVLEVDPESFKVIQRQEQASSPGHRIASLSSGKRGSA